MISELRDLSYEECGLTILETRRIRGDQIEEFRILNETIYRTIFSLLRKIVELEA